QSFLMTSVRATGSAPITAASESLGFRPAPGLRGAAAFFAAGAFLAAGVFFAATFLAAAVLPAGAALPKVLRGGNLLPPSRGANSKVTLPSSAFQVRKALKARRVRMLTNLSSRSVLPV